jgi:hypothetical protein
MNVFRPVFRPKDWYKIVVLQSHGDRSSESFSGISYSAILPGYFSKRLKSFEVV